MIRELTISNYKTIVNLTIPLNRFTVLIGENGAGKSNILEALVLASAAAHGKLDRELLIGRGIRVPSPDLMRSAFTSETKNKPISIAVSSSSARGGTDEFEFSITHDGDPYSDWKILNPVSINKHESITAFLRKILTQLPKEEKLSELQLATKEVELITSMLTRLSEAPKDENTRNKSSRSKAKSIPIESFLLRNAFGHLIERESLEKFTVYSPDYYTLRNFVAEGQTAPLGTRGEGLLKLLASMQEKERERVDDVNEGLKILGWYKEIDTEALAGAVKENRLLVKDRFIRRRGLPIDQISTNEGFLFCLFYLVLVTSSNTPQAFAIENIESGLNPKLCENLVKKLKTLAKKYGKQIILSTHSPSALDALNLDSEDDLLLAVNRNLDGHTRANKISKPREVTGKTTRLSEAFLKGHIGGLPRNFA